MSNETMYRQQAGSTDYPVPAEAAQWQKRALIVGVVGALRLRGRSRDVAGAVHARLSDRLHVLDWA